MKKIIQLAFMMLFAVHVFAQYENDEKLTILGGMTTSGSEFVFWKYNVYGGNFQLVYDVKKIQEGAIALKASGSWADGFSGYYAGPNFRIGSRFFGDVDLLFGYSSISNEKLLTSYPKIDKYSGGAFVGNLGFGYRFPNNPLLVRLAFLSHFPFQKNVAVNYGYNLQIGYRF